MKNTIEIKMINLNSTPLNTGSVNNGYFHVFSMGRFSCGFDYITKRKDYNNYLLLFTLDGAGMLEYEGIKYTVRKGDLFIIDCMNEQTYYTSEEPWEFLYMHIGGISCNGYYNTIKDKFGISGHMHAGEDFANVWKDIFMLINNNYLFNEARVSLLVCEALTIIIEGKRSDAPFDKIFRQMEHGYNEKLTISDMTMMVNMSKYHFIRRFKEETGLTPYKYLTIIRINKAKSLLSGTKLPIGEIALSVGYESQANFTKKFVEITKITPIKFRKMYRVY